MKTGAPPSAPGTGARGVFPPRRSRGAPTVRKRTRHGTTTNRLSGIGTGSPNRLLYSLFF